jgi:peptidoglycan-associated lipoprotein
MTKTLKAVGIALLVVLALAAVGCRTKKTPAPVTAPPVATETAPPVVAPPPTRVEPPVDFVKPEPAVTEEVLPSDIDELNRVAQQRGYIQDAFFAFDESTLSADAQSALTNSANWLKKNSSYGLLIEGHCDERGTEQYNLALGDRRANTAKEYLQTLGIDASRLRTVSYGEERPFDAGHDESAWAKNRRDHLVIIGK